MNVLQKLMIDGAPTAVKRRQDSEYIKQKLDAREDDSYIVAFRGVTAYQANYYQSNVKKKVTEYDVSLVDVPFIYYSPSAILSNKIPLFDINFISSDQKIINPFLAGEDGKFSEQMLNDAKRRIEVLEEDDIWKDRTDELKDELDEIAKGAREGKDKSNVALSLQEVVSKWYIAMRNLSITGLLVILVYVGIRILISATADEEAKYKTMLKDWAMGLVLVMFLHIIMLLLINLAQTITEMIKTKGVDFVNDAIRRRLLYEQNQN